MASSMPGREIGTPTRRQEWLTDLKTSRRFLCRGR